jgi:hypothetical protein
MTVRAQESQVLGTVVKPVAVDVVDLQGDPDPTPFRAQAATAALLHAADRKEGRSTAAKLLDSRIALSRSARGMTGGSSWLISEVW